MRLSREELGALFEHLIKRSVSIWFVMTRSSRSTACESSGRQSSGKSFAACSPSACGQSGQARLPRRDDLVEEPL
jgi:hypothetical protein